MKYLFICWFLVAAWNAKATRAVCWDTGCQLDSWAVRGCQQYGMVETGQKSCPHGIIYSCCEQNQTSTPSLLTPKSKCWDTGCQLNSWAIRGCQQYDMIETGQKSCPDGIIYSCCEENYNAVPSRISRPKCWDTGCQLDSWAVRGCEQYSMVETAQKSCQNGIIYSCCEVNISNNISTTSNRDVSSTISNANSTTNKAKPKCWDTGCQLNSWKVRGCEQYDMVEVGQKWCDGGLVYSCCDKNVAGSATPVHSLEPKCWDTGCQFDSWAVRGCGQYGMIETGQKPCQNGIIYSCCETNANSSGSISGQTSTEYISNKVSNNDDIVFPTDNNKNGDNKNGVSSIKVHMGKPKCWDTGCQLDSWKVRGCEQYDMAEVGQKWCDGGIVYSCCDKNATDLATSAHTFKPKCWDTGCQLDSWAVRGCEQYHMVEIGQKPCHQGIVYSCCEKNETAQVNASSPTDESTTPHVIVVTPSTPASQPKCWETGCQLGSWAVRGCEQYDMIETGQRPCQNGIIYSCCHKNGTSVASAANVATSSKPKCWDTGCQLDSWAVRGCEQYDMLEVGQKSCPNGIVYSCCDKNVTTAPSSPKLESKCWETDCQLDSWDVRGCEQYNMEEVSQEPCDNGIVYSCCHINGTAPVVPQPPKKCWDTGCQLDVWTSRGCAQYGMIEKSQRACTNGIVFTCCRP